MKRFALLALATLLALVGCYDDTALWDEIRDHESRLAKLETLCNKLNTNISSLQTIVSALQDKDYVTNVAPIKQNGKEIGYTITFSKSGTITVYHGADGKDGANGTNGTNGKDGSTPVIGTRKDTDGCYYWTLNGEWLRNDAGAKIPTTGKNGVNGANGANGTNGTNGADGADGVTPQLKIKDGYWYVSYDNGSSWNQLGKAVGDNGTDGEAGEDGDSFFKSVTQDENNVYITLADGTEIVLPKTQTSGLTFGIVEIGEDHIVFGGEVSEKAVDLKLTVYYGRVENITIYKNDGKVSVTEFASGSNSFSLVLAGLEKDCEYFYFTEIICNGSTRYSSVESFRILDSPEDEPAPDTPNTLQMYYGYISRDLRIKYGLTFNVGYSGITEECINEAISSGTIQSIDAKTMGKTPIGYLPKSSLILIATPASKNYNVTMDNGIGGKVKFESTTPNSNGEYTVNINNTTYELYGIQINAEISGISTDNIFFYID